MPKLEWAGEIFLITVWLSAIRKGHKKNINVLAIIFIDIAKTSVAKIRG